MPKNRYSPESDPADLPEFARQQRLPIVLTDYPITRRQRVHVVVFPGDEPQFMTQSLPEALLMACPDYKGRAIISHEPLARAPELCYVSISPINIKVNPNG